MWTFEHTQETTALPDAIWAYYAAPEAAPQYDPLVKKVAHEAFVKGGRGRVYPYGGGSFPSVYTEVTPSQSYTEVVHVPLGKMTYTHRLSATPTGARFTHGVLISGPLSWFYTLLFQRQHERGLPQAARNLARMAEEHPIPSPVSKQD